ncbi:MAG: CoA-binding protein [Candidatus Diapherotrites archaeon]|nr:CoA-binding protein [Candidatus Diapherotrites archaeon]
MEALFSPRSIAVVGASHNPQKVGHVLFYNLLRSFDGPVYPVNVKGGEILGKKVYKSLKELPEVPDLVFIAIPAPSVPTVMKEAVEMGVKAMVIISGGFGEVGNEELDEELKKALGGRDLPVLGPNCIGIYTPRFNGTFLSPERMDFPPRGSVSILSQSGAIIAAMLDVFAREDIGVSKVVSLGNKLFLDEVDFLKYLKGDPETDVVVLYLEDVKRGRALFEELREMSRHKPVIILKGGKTKSGMKAASSHTEAMLGDYDVFRGAMRQAGVIEVNSLEEMVDVILSLKQPLPRGNKLLIVTNGGGFGVLASDYAEEFGLELSPWKKELDLPPHVVQSNPFDLTGDARPEWYLEVLRRSEDYDAALVIITPQLATVDPSIARLLSLSPIPVYAFVPGWKYGEYLREKLIEAGIPAYESLRDAMRTIAKLVDYSRRRRLL